MSGRGLQEPSSIPRPRRGVCSVTRPDRATTLFRKASQDDEGFSGASFDRTEWLTTIRALREFVESRMNA